VLNVTIALTKGISKWKTNTPIESLYVPSLLPLAEWLQTPHTSGEWAVLEIIFIGDVACSFFQCDGLGTV
jgi:hypothetical protein